MAVWKKGAITSSGCASTRHSSVDQGRGHQGPNYGLWLGIGILGLP